MKYFCLIVAAMLLLCLAAMPYGYYMLLRFVAMICFGLLAYQYYEREQHVLMVTFGALALLFQPFFKIALGRTIWNIVDVVVAILLFGIVIIKEK